MVGVGTVGLAPVCLSGWGPRFCCDRLAAGQERCASLVLTFPISACQMRFMGPFLTFPIGRGAGPGAGGGVRAAGLARALRGRGEDVHLPCALWG
jgi:hypothetical protein